MEPIARSERQPDGRDRGAIDPGASLDHKNRTVLFDVENLRHGGIRQRRAESDVAIGERDIGNQPLIGADPLEIGRLYRWHRGPVDPAILVDVGRVIGEMDGPDVKRCARAVEMHARPNALRWGSDFRRDQTVGVGKIAILDFLANDRDVEGCAAHRVDGYARARLAAAFDKSGLGHGAQRSVDRCAGTAEFSREIRLVRDQITRLPCARMNAVENF